MFTIFIALFLGLIAGYAFRSSDRFSRLANRCAAWLVFFLLFTLGAGTGQNAFLFERSGIILCHSLLLFLGTTLGSAVAGRIVCAFFAEIPPSSPSPSPSDSSPPGKKSAVKEIARNSLPILAVFLAGILAGQYASFLTRKTIEDSSAIILHVLLFAVGIGIGRTPQAWRALAHRKKLMLFLPFSAILGSLAGGMLMIPLLRHHFTPGQILAASSGFGYYSLSSILISAHGFAILGTVSLICNLLRELGVILLMGPLVRIFTPCGAIAAAGAASMDTILPFIARQTNTEYAFLSIINGTILSIAVPILVPVFLSL